MSIYSIHHLRQRIDLYRPYCNLSYRKCLIKNHNTMTDSSTTKTIILETRSIKYNFVRRDNKIQLLIRFPFSVARQGSFERTFTGLDDKQSHQSAVIREFFSTNFIRKIELDTLAKCVVLYKNDGLLWNKQVMDEIEKIALKEIRGRANS